MNLQDITNLIHLRNHLTLLVNSERGVVTKDRVREVLSLKTDMDRLILDSALELDLEALEDGEAEDTVAMTERLSQKKQELKHNAEKLALEDKQMSFNFDDSADKEPVTAASPPKKTSKKASKKKTDEQIAARIAQAKEEVAKQSGSGTFKRAGAAVPDK